MNSPAPGAAIDQVALLEVFLIEANECLHEMRQALREMHAPADRRRGAVDAGCCTVGHR